MTIKYGTAIIFENTVLRYGEKLEKKITPFYYLLTAGIVSAFFIFLGAAIRLAINSYKQEKARKTLESEKMSAELSFLKSQINPHFLFNSLNNIYSLAYRKSDRAPEAILKLADIMRYMIQENPDKLVSLNDEITYLKNYIALQQLRFKDSLAIELEVDADHFDYRMMPLLLISFLENAFKHGIATDHEHPIRILIEIKNSRLHFKVSNLKGRANKDKGRGIGIENLQRRLALGYPNRHTFNIQDGEKFYTSEFFVYLYSLRNMTMIRCLVVDDEPLALDVITDYIQKVPELTLVSSTTNSIEGLGMVQRGEIDLVFLDVQMPELSGIQFLKIINGQCNVILTTAYPEYALDGYDLNVIDYLLKPIAFERFKKAVLKVLNNNVHATEISKNFSDFIFVKAEHKIHRIDLIDILYIEGLKDYISIYTLSNRIITLQNMKKMEETLPSPDFIRVHKSYIVALDKIECIERGKITIQDKVIPIGDTFREDFFKRVEEKKS